MDGVVSSYSSEENGDYIKVNYNDNDGKEHSVTCGHQKNMILKKGIQ